MPLIIGLDLGTTHAKAIALNENGAVIASASRAYPILTPQAGRAEQDPLEVWRGAAQALQELSGQLDPRQIAGVCLSGAMHSSLPVSADGTPLAPAMTWADQRADAIARQLRTQADRPALYQRTGCPLQPIYHVAKLRWWVENEAAISGRLARFVTLKDYVLFCLTGEWLADISVYAATGLLDIRRYTWDEEALSLAGVTPARLPPLASPDTIAGKLNETSARLTGLPLNTPIVLGASDGGLANLGSGASRPGQSVITVGTSGAVRRIVAEPYLDLAPAAGEDSRPQQERTWCYLLAKERWFAGGAINNGGLAVQWIRDQFYPDLPGEAGYQRMFQNAGEISPGSEGVSVLPFFAGERSPYWNANARATITGLGLNADRRHIARAVLEGVAYRLGDIWDVLHAPLAEEPVRLTGGILQSPVWAQIVCDVIGTPLAAVETGDASAVGAAMLGFVALGLAPSLDDLAQRVQPGMHWQPDPANQAVYRAGLARFRTAYQAIYPQTN